MGIDTLTNDDAEQSVLGTILIHPVTFADVADVLHADDFAHPARSGIYEAMVSLTKQNRPIDLVTVVAELKALDLHDRLRSVGGEDYLLQLQTYIASIEHVRYHARVVRNRARRRRCAAGLAKLNTACYSAVDDEEFFDDLERGFAEMIQPLLGDGGPQAVQDILKGFVKELATKYEARAAAMRLVDPEARRKALAELDAPGVRTGFGKIDWLLGGLQAAKLYLIGARPSMGKSSWLLDALGYAAEHGTPGILFSLEMEKKENVARWLSQRGRVDGGKIMRASFEPREWSALVGAAGHVNKWQMHVDDRAGLTFDAIRSEARRWRMKHPRTAKGQYLTKAIVAIDYLQLIRGAGENDHRRPENRQQEITRISTGLKELCKELQCPVVALSQLNRGLENRDDKRPKMADLRESGSLEQDADVVCFLYRDEVYSKDKCPDEDKGVAEFIVEKHRGGAVGMDRLKWLGQYTHFENIETRREAGSEG